MSPFDFYPTLENKRALLRPLKASDQELLAEIALNEPELWRFTATLINSPEVLQAYFETALNEREQGISIPFLIFDKEKNKAAGCTRFMQPNAQHKRVEIGWTWLGREFQGSGLNKAMKYLLLQHAFEAMDMNRVELKTSELNTPSRNAIASIGAVQEGILRSHMINDDGTVRNTVYFSIIKEEWPSVQARIFQKHLHKWH